MTNVFQTVKSVIYVLLLAAVAFIVLWNIRPLDRAVQNLLDQAASLDAIDLFGVKLTFNTATVYENLNFDHLKPVDKDRVHGKLYGLTPKEYERLMNIGKLGDLCIFATQDSGMREALAVDHELRDKGLTNIEESLATLAAVREKMDAGAIDRRNGDPTSCYVMSLTDDGYNAKTVLTKTLSRKFGGPAGSK